MKEIHTGRKKFIFYYLKKNISIGVKKQHFPVKKTKTNFKLHHNQSANSDAN